MRAGMLRERVTIEQKSVTRDGYGGEVITWTTLATVWASVEPLTGAEFYEGTAERVTVNTRIRLRYRTDVTAAMRVSYGARLFDVVSVVNPHSDREMTVLMCVEMVS